MQALENPTRGFVNDTQEKPSKHFGYLVYDFRAAVAPQPQELLRAAGEDEEKVGNKRILTLKGEHVEILPGRGSAAAALKLDTTVPPNPHNPENDPDSPGRQSLHWLTSLATLNSRALLVNPALLQDSFPPDLTARIRLTEGSLFGDPAAYTEQTFTLSSVDEQVLAIRIVLEREGIEGHVDIQLTQWTGDPLTKGQPRLLRLAPPAGGQSVEISFRHVEDEIHKEAASPAKAGGKALDVEHFYDLADGLAADAPRAIPQGGGDHGARATCVPVQFTG